MDMAGRRESGIRYDGVAQLSPRGPALSVWAIYTTITPEALLLLGSCSAWRWAGWCSPEHSAEERRASTRPGWTLGGKGDANPDSCVADGVSGDAAGGGMP